ncbi:TPM domain-containing protein [Cochlodiniinecator piscidefendens]|uniref:TPM domain-containing protein n=1 Tax=Cochlodiniinecator piscidefendens TaxID=2715756 RepID=UPI0014095930|nr:TPM domain-containing protein [Cochlodiniinecator piscidefendens]
MIRMLIFVGLLLFAPISGFSQTFPEYDDVYVNDYANLISAEDEEVLQRTLQILKADNDIEMTVLTVPSWRDYRGGYPTLDRFATALFNHWGIGHNERNDGILVLVAQSEREIRIELGAGYPESYDRRAEQIIEQSFLPAFRADAYSRGIRQGVSSLVIDLAKPFAEGATTPRGGHNGSNGRNPVTFLIPFAIFAAFIGAKKFLPNYLRRCPACKSRATLHRESRTIQEATSTMEGTREIHEHCSQCGYESDYSENIPLRTHKRTGRSSFGGGSSSGGGASGRW